MKFKAYFIMILILLAAQFGAAQEVIVVYEGAETSHEVDNHPGNEYRWEVYKNFNPDIPAEPTEFYFISSDNKNELTVHWIRAGLYFLKVIETDPTGCSNVKALAVSVISNNRSVGFEELSSNECYKEADNGFTIPLDILDNEGKALDESYYPIELSFYVNGNSYKQTIVSDFQEINITDSMFSILSDGDTEVLVEIESAADNQNGGIQAAENKPHTRTIFLKPEIGFINSISKITQGTEFTHFVEMNLGNADSATYSWSVVLLEGTSTDLSSIESNSARILWDGPLGVYSLKVSAVDGNGCFSDTIIQQLEIVEPDELIVYAGNDTIIGSCNPYQLNALVSDTIGLSYLWAPDEGLDDPTILNPVFTPGATTSLVLTATTSDGVLVKDTVEVRISEIYANAGEDFVIEEGATAMLDGTESSGEALKYSWTTFNGTIDSGENTANPVINSSGTYYLQLTDLYDCVATDSVVVGLITYAPVANDDYDTTNFQTAVNVLVLDNDNDSDGNLDPTTLSIQQYPVNGNVYINYNDYTISYTPNDGFIGGDVFEYKICDLTAKCDNAHVYVVVLPINFFIPEAFTPNGDNINDYFEIKGIEYYEGNSITIVNRWGKTVYKAKNYGLSTTPKFWDGKWQKGGNNDDLPTGTYFYVLDLGKGQKPIAGSVYIDR